MTTAAALRLQRAIRRASVAAARAPSVLGTQPWRVVRRRDALEIHADRTRQLRALDPDGRQLVFSCGSAVTNAVVSLAADALATDVKRYPDPNRRDLLASIHIRAGVPVGDAANATVLLCGIDVAEARSLRLPEQRSTFVDSAGVRMVAAEGLDATRVVVARAEEILRVDPSAFIEVRACRDRAAALPGPVSPISFGVAWSRGDDPIDWLEAGERFQRAALELGIDGVAALPFVAVTAYRETREALGAAIALPGTAQLLFRAVVAAPTASSRRRRLVETLVDAD